ncbi:hypothetical protein [Streptomyces zaomyceticus]|uniref:hypothetical protein n=1 Tax=Streptomyces zaomyceticus TaxID=68286 RepID=UPI0034221F8C
MSMAELVAAGAPELPEGHFYRVRESSNALLKVELRRQGRWLSALVDDVYVRPGSYETPEAAVVAACKRVFEDWEARQADCAAFRASRSLLGDHDPRGGK